MKQCVEVSKEEEKITVKRSEGRRLQVEKMQCAPALVVAQAQAEKKATSVTKKGTITGWPTEMPGEVASRQDYNVMEEMVQ